MKKFILLFIIVWTIVFLKVFVFPSYKKVTIITKKTTLVDMISPNDMILFSETGMVITEHIYVKSEEVLSVDIDYVRIYNPSFKEDFNKAIIKYKIW